jgi:hypothetical protein
MEMEEKKIKKNLWCNYKVKGYNNTIEAFRHERFLKICKTYKSFLKKFRNFSTKKKGMKISLHL